MKRILAIAALMLAASPLAFSQTTQSQATTAGQAGGGTAEQEVLKVNKEYGEAFVRGDLAALGRLVADDLTSTGYDGKVVDKAGMIEDIKAGNWKYEFGRDDNVRARLYGDTAVVTGLWTSKGQYRGKDFNRQERYTCVFVKRDGRWQLVAEHLTLVGAPPQGQP